MEVRRGDLVAIALSGDYGKPRPAVIVQADIFDALPSVTILPLTSELHDEHLLRILVQPNKENGLRRSSQVMVDKVSTVARTKIGSRLGRMDTTTMQTIDVALARFLGISSGGPTT